MQTTIGEVVNMILPFCASIEMKCVYKYPFIRAVLKNSRDYAVAYMYIIQTGKHIYSIFDSSDVINGERYFPTGSVYCPLMGERELIHRIFDKYNPENEKDIIKTDLTYLQLMNYIYEKLYMYFITRFHPKHLNRKISDMGFKSNRIKHNIGKTFENNGYDPEDGNIRDMINIVLNNPSGFMLGSIRPKENHIIDVKLRDLGLIPIIKDNYIIEFDYERFKERKDEEVYVTEER